MIGYGNIAAGVERLARTFGMQVLIAEHKNATTIRPGRAGFDVLSVEPPALNDAQRNPLLDLNLPNFLLTPHVAWSSREAMQTLADQLMDNIEAFVRGEVRNRVV